MEASRRIHAISLRCHTWSPRGPISRRNRPIRRWRYRPRWKARCKIFNVSHIAKSCKRSNPIGPMLSPTASVSNRTQKKAKNWLIKSAKQGSASAQFNLGDFYLSARHTREAHKWFKLAAAKNHSTAECKLGIMYLNGTGVKTISLKPPNGSI